MLTSVLAGMSILIVGDSHLIDPAHLLSSLHDGLTQNGAVVHTIGVCGSTPGDWLKATPGTCGGAERRGTQQATVHASGVQTQPIKELLTAEKPNLIVVVMGDTMAGYDKGSFAKSWAWQTTTQFTKAIASTDTACIWVGPAWGTEGGKYKKTFARVQQVSSFLASNVAPCAYIDSLQFSKPGEWATLDGQHFTQNGYKIWGQAITDAIVKTVGAKASDAKNDTKKKP